VEPEFPDRREFSASGARLQQGNLMFKNRLNELWGNSGKPLQKVLNACAVSKVFKQCANGNASCAKHKFSGADIGMLLDGATVFPKLV
jgi:hypothetical protein